MDVIYYKFPLIADLSQTSYRAYAEKEGFAYVEYNEGQIGEDWEQVTLDELIQIFGNNPFEDVQEPETVPYQPSNSEIAQMISDLQADLIISGVI